jgi:hypothetical protein
MSDTRPRKRSLFVRRDANLDDKILVRHFLGGMRYGPTGLLNWSSPLITLCLYRSGLELRATSPWLFPVPPWRARYDEIAAVHWLGGPGPDSPLVIGLVVARGVMFTTTDGSWAIFWCRQRDQVLHTLAQLGLRIEANPAGSCRRRPRRAIDCQISSRHAATVPASTAWRTATNPSRTKESTSTWP